MRCLVQRDFILSVFAKFVKTNARGTRRWVQRHFKVHFIAWIIIKKNVRCMECNETSK